MSKVEVRTMTPAEYDEWMRQLARDYADEQVTAGNWPVEGSFQRAFDENSAQLPQGPQTPGMLVLKGVLDDGTPIGRLWISLEHPRGTPDCAFLYDIEVDAPHRGQGLGRGLMAAAEQAVRERGVGSLMLNVFGDNTAAIALYNSSGYAVTQQWMRKSL